MFPVWISINAIFLLLIPTTDGIAGILVIRDDVSSLSCLVSSYHKNEYKTMVGVFHRCLIRKM